MIRIKEITFEKFLEINPNNTAILKEFELNKIRIVLKNKFRTQKNIAKKLGCSRRLVGMVLKKERNPTLNLTLKICKLSNTNIKELIEKITPKFNCYGSYITPKDFPIKLDARLAALTGHILGDGHLGKKYFNYTNTNDVLINNLMCLVETLPIHNLSFNIWEHKGKSLRFSTLVRDVLTCADIPIGNKTLSKTFIPNWVKNANVKIKSYFLRAFFDDEGYVSLKDRTIGFSLSKNISLENNLDNFVNDIKRLLKDIGIKRISIKTYICNKKGKNGNTLIKTLTFYGYFNFKIFQEKIGFLHPEKNRRLANWINNIQIIRLEKNERKSLFIKTIRENPLLNAKQISEKINIHHHYALNYLNNLWTQELVKKTSNEWPRRWYLSDKALRID